MYKHLVIDTTKNKLLCDPSLVGIGELVEVYTPDDDTPPQAGGRVLRKNANGTYSVHLVETHGNGTAAGHPAQPPGKSLSPLSYRIGEFAILRVLGRNRSGIARRRFRNEEKKIVSLERTGGQKEVLVVKAKTGSVRKKKDS